MDAEAAAPIVARNDLDDQDATLDTLTVRRDGVDRVVIEGAAGARRVGFSLAVLFNGAQYPRWLWIDKAGLIQIKGFNPAGEAVQVAFRPVLFHREQQPGVDEGGTLVCERADP